MPQSDNASTPLHAMEGFQTLTSRVYLALRQEILAGVMKPGARLSRRVLGAKLGVSPIPVIEALHQLERDGLVESEPMYGHRVRLLTVESVRNDHVLREAIECQAARMCAANASDAQFKDLARLAQSLDKRLLSKEAGASYSDEHLAFHLAVARLTGCTILHSTLETLWFRHLMLINTINAAALGVPKQWHAKLVKALATRDPDPAEKAMREHVSYNVAEQLEWIARNRLPGTSISAVAASERPDARRRSVKRGRR